MPLDEAIGDKPPTILVIDDDEISLAVITLILDAEGYSVMQAPGGDEAVKLAAELTDGGEPSVVLADLQMPGLCGLELALAMRTLLPQTMLVAMSASPGTTTPEAAEGYDGFVNKPLDLDEFRSLLAGTGAKSTRAEVVQPANAGGPVLDEEVYGKLRRMMPAASLAEVYEVCLSDARSRAAQMTELAEESGDDLGPVRRSAHAIKGGAGMVGAAMLASAAARLELGNYRKSDLPTLINNLLDSCDQLQRMLINKAKAL
jgi:CheY-like chemotaxis protein